MPGRGPGPDAPARPGQPVAARPPARPVSDRGRVLWRSPRMSLRSLRLWELVHFATAAAFYGLFRFEMLAHVAGGARTRRRWRSGSRRPSPCSGSSRLILAYGVLVPNTRRRSLLGVAAADRRPVRGDRGRRRGQPGLRDGRTSSRCWSRRRPTWSSRRPSRCSPPPARRPSSGGRSRPSGGPNRSASTRSSGSSARAAWARCGWPSTGCSSGRARSSSSARSWPPTRRPRPGSSGRCRRSPG